MIPSETTDPGATVSSEAPRCLNCGAELSGPWCSQCGQEDHDLRVSLRRLGSEFFAEHLGVESKVPQTFRALVTRPGFLTQEYLAGRRARWVLPLKLYLTSSVLYFLLMSLPFLGDLRTDVTFSETDSAAVDSASAETRRPPIVSGDDTASSALERRLAERAAKVGTMSSEEQSERFTKGLATWMPNAVFVLLPIFAGLLYLLYRDTGRFFAEHLIFALHVHAFAFLILTLNLFVPEPFGLVGQLWLLVYVYLALRRVYAESPRRTALKFAGLVVPYGILLIGVTMFVLLAIFATV